MGRSPGMRLTRSAVGRQYIWVVGLAVLLCLAELGLGLSACILECVVSDAHHISILTGDDTSASLSHPLRSLASSSGFLQSSTD
ncbi:hypothetical protein C8Q80DRAFT_1148913 [Daedaleopsis nitida]|nr:hypothetical protein C8Q80DRAFT_1148913 [Daedaleopsis nitida]